ncbi:MAG: ATP-binding protein, partial [Acidimicrobiales bacterium]
MFRHIRTKLIAAFAVPLAILVAVAGLETFSSMGQINRVNEETALATAAVSPGGVVQALQTEREYAVLRVLGAATGLPNALAGLGPRQGGLSQAPAQVVETTDSAVDGFRQTVASAGSEAQGTYSGALAAFGRLPAARAEWSRTQSGARYIAGYQGRAQAAYEDYTSMIDALVAGTGEVPMQVSDTTLRSGVEALYASLQASEAQWQALDDLSQAAWLPGQAQASELLAANQEYGRSQAWTNQLLALATGPYATAVTTLTGQAAASSAGGSPVAKALRADVAIVDHNLGLSHPARGSRAVPPLASAFAAFSQPAFGTVSGTTPTTQVTASAVGDQQIAAVVHQRSGALHSGAVERTVLFGLLGLLGAVAGLVLVALVSRSVSKPLVELAGQAEELATTTLPATLQSILDSTGSGEAPKLPKVRVHSRDEVAGMARALDAVNKTAVELAAGQASLRRNLADAFVNLGRRNQNLVTRQLEYISEIELKEADPESLEELFRLDHLATRMRRNAESLLILAGSGPARQWGAAVPAMDVARAASAEVEDYKRLRLHHFDPAQMTGVVTTDLVHILAELIENALTFSPPASPVDIYGRFLEGGYVIVIVDSGIGMSADDLDLANRRLQGKGSNDEVPGRYLGHFVAGRLAARHGISISLQASHSGGLVARVKVPSGLIEEPVADLSAGAEIRPLPSVPPKAAPPPAGVGPALSGLAAPAPLSDGNGAPGDGYAAGSGGYAAGSGGYAARGDGYPAGSGPPGAHPLNGPAQPVPGSPAPAYNPPASSPPTFDPPAYNAPAQNPPAYNSPADNPPVSSPPAEDPPASGPPTVGPAAFDPSAFDPSAFDPSARSAAHDPSATAAGLAQAAAAAAAPAGDGATSPAPLGTGAPARNSDLFHTSSFMKELSPEDLLPGPRKAPPPASPPATVDAAVPAPGTAPPEISAPPEAADARVPEVRSGWDPLAADDRNDDLDASAEAEAAYAAPAPVAPGATNAGPGAGAVVPPQPIT